MLFRSHLVVNAAAGSRSLDALYDAPDAAAFQALQDALPAAIGVLQTVLQPLMARHAVGNVNPITYHFMPDHTGMDALLDSISVGYSGNNVTLTDRGSGAILMVASATNLVSSVSATQWSTADALNAAEIDVAVGNSGVGIVTWTEAAGGQLQLKARLMNGLDTGRILRTAGDAASPRVVMDGAGNALAVWSQTTGGLGDIWASRYSASDSVWSAAHQLSVSTAVAGASLPDVAADQTGNAVVVWQQSDGRTNHRDGWMAQYAAGTDAWTAAAMLSDGVNSAHGLHVSLNATGQGLVAWQQDRGDGSNTGQPLDVWARSVNTAGALGSSRAISAAADYVYGHLAVATNAGGGSAVLWSRRSTPAAPMVIEAAVYSPAGGWQAASPISQDGTDDCYAPRVVFDAAGNALAVWQQQSNYSSYGSSNRYVAGAGWSGATFFVDSKAGDAFAPALAMDAAGNATAVWFRWSPTNAIDLMIDRYTAAGGWLGAQVFAPLGVSANMLRSLPEVVSNARGQALVVWALR